MKDIEQSSQKTNESYVPVDLDRLDEIALQQINPRIVDAIKAIQAERLGEEPISWQDFSSHTQK